MELAYFCEIMCGITGTIGFESVNNFSELTNNLKHRGPDAEGHFWDKSKNIFLGHTRLSVVDLSPTGNQPFWSACKRYVMVFNGEIYNHKEVAKNLHINLKTNSDTEIIVEGFALIGKKICGLLNGMFAFVIYDTRTDTFFMARDRMGIKPLYLFRKNEKWAFSSELQSLVKCSFMKKELSINSSALMNFLHLGFIPQPHTAFNEIEKFPAGYFAYSKNGEWLIEPFYEIKNQLSKTTFKGSFAEAKEAYKQLLESSVSYRLMSDVPFGMFLSGGIDSSLVSAVAAKVSGTKVKTFSIGFEESAFDESKYASEVAKKIGSEHTEQIISEKDALPILDKALEITGEPFADSSLAPTYLVSKMAAKSVKMVLSGDGGDELFMGYGFYKWALRFSNPLMRTSGNIASPFLAMGNSRVKRVSKLINTHPSTFLPGHIFSQEQYYFSQKELQSKAFIQKFQPYTFPLESFNRKLSDVEKQAYFDLNVYLRDDLLVKVDLASMQNSLEARVPLLDHRLVEFAINLPEYWKINQGKQKYFLKEVLFDYLPRQLFDRPKWGFGVPLAKWLKSDLAYLHQKYLSKEMVERVGFVEFKYVETIIKRFYKGDDYLYNRIWVLILLHRFMDTYS